MFKDTIVIDSEDEEETIQNIVFPENYSSQQKRSAQYSSNNKTKSNIYGWRNSTQDRMIDESQEASSLNHFKFPLNDLQDYDAVLKYLAPASILNEFKNERSRVDVAAFLEGDFERTLLSADIPERLNRRYMTWNKVDLDMEAEWIFTRMSPKKKNSSTKSKTAVEESSISKEEVKKILQMLRIQNFEIMYIYTYHRWQLNPDTKLNHLWEIYQWDHEYQLLELHRRGLAERAKELLEKRKKDDYYSHIDKLLVNSPDIADFGISQNDPDIIDDIESWVRYQKRGESVSAFGNIAYPYIISPSQLISNIVLGFVDQPKSCEQHPEKFFCQKLNRNNLLSESEMQISPQVCMALALELSHDPVIRSQLRDVAKDYPILLYTEHTLKGNSELNIYHPNYMTKRLVKMPLHEISDELWFRILDAEKEDLILVKMKASWPKSLEPNPLIEALAKGYLDKDLKNKGNFQTEWYSVRMEVLRVLVEELFTPYYIEYARYRRTLAAEKNMIKWMSEKFRGMLDRNLIVQKSLRTASKDFCLCGLSSDPKKGGYAFVILDRAGRLIDNDHFDYKRSASAFDCEIPPTAEIKRIREKMIKYNPPRVFLSEFSLTPIEIELILRGNLERDTQNLPDFQIFYVDGTIPYQISIQEKIDEELAAKSRGVWKAASTIRQILDPIAEVAKLWNEIPTQNSVLYLPISEFLHLINPTKLHMELETILLEYANHLGVDLDVPPNHHSLPAKIQFLCGLGPIKARDLAKKFKTTERPLKSRYEIQSLQWLPSKVFQIMIGFVKFKFSPNSKEKNGFDVTRIHPSDYQFAIELCRKCLKHVGSNMDICDDTEVIDLMIREAPKISDNEIRNSGKTEEIKYKTNMILDEFGAPFADHFNRFFKSEELFYSLSGESASRLRNGMLVDGTVVKILSSDMIVRLNCGLEVEIHLTNILEKDQARNCKLTDFFFEGKPVKMRILNICFPPRDCLFDEVRDVHKLIKLELSLKETDTNNHNYYCSLLYHSVAYINVVEADDFPKPIKHSRIPFNFNSRQINSPYYKNLTEEEASVWLDTLPDGSFVIRPHPRKENFLKLTWKQRKNQLENFEVLEKSQGFDPKSKSYVMKSLVRNNYEEEYDSIEDIKRSFVYKLNDNIQAVTSFYKFRSESRAIIESELKDEKKTSHSSLPYYICFHSRPLYLWLLYVTKQGKIIREFLEINTDGFKFHGVEFPDLISVVKYLEKNFTDPRYQKYLKSIKAPSEDIVPENSEANKLEILCEDTGLGKKNSKWSLYSKYFRKAKIKKMPQPQRQVMEIEDEDENQEVVTPAKNWSGIKTERERRACFNCGSFDHLASQCQSESKKNSSKGGFECFNCQEVGHRASACPHPKKPRNDSRRNNDDWKTTPSNKESVTPNRHGGNSWSTNKDQTEGRTSNSWGNSDQRTNTDLWGDANPSSSSNVGANNDAWGSNKATNNAWGSNQTANDNRSGWGTEGKASSKNNWEDSWGGNDNSDPNKKQESIQEQSKWGNKENESRYEKRNNEKFDSRNRRNDKPDSNENKNRGNWEDGAKNGSWGITDSNREESNKNNLSGDTASSWGETNKNQNSWEASGCDWEKNNAKNNSWGASNADQNNKAKNNSWEASNSQRNNGTKDSSRDSRSWGDDNRFNSSDRNEHSRDRSQTRHREGSSHRDQSNDNRRSPTKSNSSHRDSSQGFQQRNRNNPKSDSWNVSKTESWGNSKGESRNDNRAESWGGGGSSINNTEQKQNKSNDAWADTWETPEFSEPKNPKTSHQQPNDPWRDSWDNVSTKASKPDRVNDEPRKEKDPWENQGKDSAIGNQKEDAWSDFWKDNNSKVHQKDPWENEIGKTSGCASRNVQSDKDAWGSPRKDTSMDIQPDGWNTENTTKKGNQGNNLTNNSNACDSWGRQNDAWNNSSLSDTKKNSIETENDNRSWNDKSQNVQKNSWGGGGVWNPPQKDQTNNQEKNPNNSWSSNSWNTKPSDSGNNRDSSFKSGDNSRGDKNKKSEGCYKCGELGHISKSCTKQKCFRCQKEGHRAQDCTEAPSTSRGKDRKGCFKCGSEDHFARECNSAPTSGGGRGGPGGGKGGAGGSKGCFKCGESGHFARECPNPEANSNSRRPNKERSRSAEKNRDDYGLSKRRDENNNKTGWSSNNKWESKGQESKSRSNEGWGNGSKKSTDEWENPSSKSNNDDRGADWDNPPINDSGNTTSRQAKQDEWNIPQPKTVSTQSKSAEPWEGYW